MNIKLAIAHWIRWHEMKLAWKVYKRKFILQHNLFSDKWADFGRTFDSISYNKLINGLDPESKRNVDLLLKRFSNPLSNYPALYPTEVFTHQELEEQKEFHVLKYALSKKYSIPTQELDPSPLMFQSGLKHIPDGIKKRLNGSCFLDIGAFVGQATMAFLDFQPDKIYSIEPSATNFSKLNHNLRNQIKLEKVVPLNTAMGATTGYVYFKEDHNASSISENQTETQGKKVAITTVDELVREHNIRNVGLLKLDVEGFETNVIKGALKTIAQHKPVLLISIYHSPQDFFNLKPLLQEANPDYQFLIRKLNPFWLTYDTMLISYTR